MEDRTSYILDGAAGCEEAFWKFSTLSGGKVVGVGTDGDAEDALTFEDDDVAGGLGTKEAIIELARLVVQKLAKKNVWSTGTEN